ncbi:TraM recognition domain-containing protein (plasmid) [Streptococcus ruminicola]|uniref:TraM recognition domain-containing protein n=1 Tax=Streptococcus ruminicola TaxID=2686210 RepID=A0A6G8I2J1_9STRE|nr:MULTISPECIES: TraM recognition domain-containing protein [Streptococcus]QGX47334.1 TraM recognition domain-containing protein [Streptococcus equinus]QIM47383.1 TraM recognition domain-containing protein [Streptococcus ruminicola]
MKYFLNRLQYYTKGHRTFDFVLLFCKRILQLNFGISILGLLTSLWCLVFKIKVTFGMYMLFWVIQFINLNSALYFGKWHTNLTSRQRFRLFERLSDYPRNERVISIKNYILVSFIGGIISGVNIILFTINNYILATVNSLYLNANSYLKYTDWKLNYHTLHILIGNQFSNSLLLVFPVFIYVYLFLNSYQKDIRPYQLLIDQWLESRFYKDKCIDKLVQDRDTKGISTIKIGVDSKSRTDVIMNAATRALNSVWIGLIGVGKSASIAKPIIISDTENFIFYIKTFAKYVKSKRREIANLDASEEEKRDLNESAVEEWFTKGLGKDLTNGYYVNEPSGDLIKDALEIVKRSGLPDDVVWLVDPHRKDTDAINILDADITTASALASDLFRNFSEGESSSGNTFFLNSEEAHTKNIVNLLKLTTPIAEAPINSHLKGNPPTLSEFFQLLENDDYIFARLELLKVVIKRANRLFEPFNKEFNEKYDSEFEEWISNGNPPSRFNANMSINLRKMSYRHRQEKAKLSIMTDTYTYFKKNLITDFKNESTFKFDANIDGLKNVLRRLAANPEVRRVFFSQSTKSVDALLKMGGILLVNSAKAELGDSNSKMVGQVAEIIMQSGAYRRLPNLSPIFPFMNDEKNTILMKRDQSFLDQNRKFRTPVIHLYQDYEQAVATVGRDRANALFQSYRNAFVFQQGSPDSVKYIANRGGTKLVLEESNRYAQEDLLAGNDSNATNVTETIVEKEMLTQSDMSKLEKFEYAGVMVIDDEVSDVMFITSEPSFKLPMFNKNLDYKPPFDTNNSEDMEAYKIWKEEVEKYYIKNSEREILSEKDFLPDEWLTIMSVQNPDIFEDNKSSFDDENDNIIDDKIAESGSQLKRQREAKEDLKNSKINLQEEVANDSFIEEKISLPKVKVSTRLLNNEEYVIQNEKSETVSQNQLTDFDDEDERIDFY